MTTILFGLVTASFRRHFRVLLDSGEDIECIVRGRDMAIACGDRVQVEMSAASGGQGVVTAVAPRTTLFYRSDGYREKLIAANVTQVVAIVAPDPPFDLALVDRWIVATESNDCRFVLALNKADLPTVDAARIKLEPYAQLGYPLVSLAATRDVSPLVPWLQNQKSVLIGQSGMGKSTLVNALLPDARARTGTLSVALQTGRHTTSAVELYRYGGGWLVDSPGLTEFGLHHLSPSEIEAGFVELRPLLGRCKFRDCGHATEPGCVVQQALMRGELSARRMALLRQLRAEGVSTKGRRVSG